MIEECRFVKIAKKTEKPTESRYDFNKKIINNNRFQIQSKNYVLPLLRERRANQLSKPCKKMRLNDEENNVTDVEDDDELSELNQDTQNQNVYAKSSEKINSENDSEDDGDDFEEDNDFDEDLSEDDEGLEIDQDEIDKMLDAGLDIEKISSQPSTKLTKNKIDKMVMDRGRTNHFEVLPNGWIEVTHVTGIPIYLHKATRMVTLCRPYLLGQGSKINHRIPISSIPCMDYKRQLEENKEQEKNKVELKEDIEKAILAGTKVESVNENAKKNSLAPAQVVDYCKNLFETKEVIVRVKPGKKSQERPTLPSGTILITVPVYDNNTKTMSTRDWALNPNGKSSVCVLHEYLQKALKKAPVYEYFEKGNSKTPYQAVLKIDGVIYSTRTAASKKQAKLDAAKQALGVLIPQLKSVEFDKSSSNHDDRYSIFDTIHITDPRVADCCAKSTEPSPYTMLLKCLERNFGIGEHKKISYKLHNMKHNKILFEMQAGKHSASVICKNKKEGKQLVSQQILQVLHPSIQYWGSLLRLYGNESMIGMRQKKHEEQEITKLQSKATVNSPNYDVLEKLRTELRKLSEQRENLESKEFFKLPSNIELPSASSCEANFHSDVMRPDTDSDSN